MTDAGVEQPYRANVSFDAHRAERKFGYRFLADEARARELVCGGWSGFIMSFAFRDSGSFRHPKIANLPGRFPGRHRRPGSRRRL